MNHLVSTITRGVDGAASAAAQVRYTPRQLSRRGTATAVKCR